VDIRRNDFYSEKSHEIDSDTICNCTFNIDTKTDAMDTTDFCSALKNLTNILYIQCRMYLCVCLNFMCMYASVCIYVYVIRHLRDELR